MYERLYERKGKYPRTVVLWEGGGGAPLYEGTVLANRTL